MVIGMMMMLSYVVIHICKHSNTQENEEFFREIVCYLLLYFFIIYHIPTLVFILTCLLHFIYLHALTIILTCNAFLMILLPTT